MKTILSHIVLSVLALLYFIGSVGFTVHHCCCKKVYHTTACLADVFCPYEIHECLKKEEDSQAGNKLTFRPYRHCGMYTYSMDHVKYNCQKKVPAPLLYLVMLQDMAIISSRPQKLDYSISGAVAPDFYNHMYKRRWCEQARLCLFIV